MQMQISPINGPASMPTMVHIDVYIVEAPVGDLSVRSVFWPLVDRHDIAPSLQHRLARNEVQCGLAKKSRWPRFRAVLDALPCRVRKLSINGQQGTDLSVDLGREMPNEDVFLFDEHERLSGRSFQLCRNYMSLGFLPVEHNAAVRISLAPVVKCRLNVINVTPLNREFASPYETTDHLLAAALHVNVPKDDFLVVGNRPGALDPTSVGGAFFIDRSGSERLERVLLIVPTYLNFNSKRFTLLEMADRP